MAVNIKTTTGTCPLYGHEEEEQASNEQQNDSNQTNLLLFTFR
jgi:hypothetical protein